MPNLTIRDECITLARAVKAAGLAESGGQAKFFVRDGQVTVNGNVETQPGHKLRPGDRFAVPNVPEWIICHGQDA